MSMGRRRTKDFDLPPHMRRKGDFYYYDHGGKPRKYTPLGKSRPEAMAQWALLYAAETGEVVAQADALFATAALQYRRKVLVTKARKTQIEQDKQLARLVKVFGEMAVADITPQDVRDYMNLRGDKAPVAANREKALLSHVINMARQWGLSNTANPCSGVRGYKEEARDRFIEDAEYRAVRLAADPTLRDALDLALLTGQRPADVLKLRRSDVRDGHLWVKQNKTGEKLRIVIEGDLATIINRANERKVASLFLIADENGKALTADALRYRFDRAREKAGISFQFRDMRAKAASEVGDLQDAQALLGHKHATTTDRYLRRRAGRVVKPLNRKIVE